MAHVLIIGMTESGKTTLARGLAKRYRAAGIGTLVLDPLRDPKWQADYMTDDGEDFLRTFWLSRSCAAFLDEGGESVGRYDKAMQMTATRGRHCGHSCHYIAQRVQQLAPIVRDQCTHLFLFCSSAKDGALLADEFNMPELAQCSRLAQGEYIHAVKFGKSSINKLGDKNGSGNRGIGSRRGDARHLSEESAEGEDGGTGSAGPQGGEEA